MKRKRQSLFPKICTSKTEEEAESKSATENRFKKIDYEWRSLKHNFDAEVDDIRHLRHMPLSKWIRWNTEDQSFQYMRSKECKQRMIFRMTDERVLKVIQLHINQNLTPLSTVTISESLIQRIEDVFMNPCENTKSCMLQSLSPPNSFPKDHVGKSNKK